MGFTNWLKNTGSKVWDLLGKGADLFCDTIDYLRYDQGLLATTLRAVDTVACTLASPAMALVEVAAKVSYYGTGYLLGQTKEQMDKSLEIVTNAIGNIENKCMKFLEDKGLNVRFIGDVVSTGLHIIDYFAVGKLTRTGLNKVNGIYKEGARRYRAKLLEKAEKAKNREIEKINRNFRDREKNNLEKYKQNRQIAKARNDAIKEDFKRQKEEIKNKKLLLDPKFRSKLGRILKRQLNDFFKYLRNISYNGWWLIKQDFMNYANNLSGNMGNYGFHTCPYGCGRPIPDAFPGCTELLQAFPDYFD